MPRRRRSNPFPFLALLLGLFLSACSSPFFQPTREVKVPSFLDRFPREELSFRSRDDVPLSAWRIDPPAGTPCRATKEATAVAPRGNRGPCRPSTGGASITTGRLASRQR